MKLKGWGHVKLLNMFSRFTTESMRLKDAEKILAYRSISQIFRGEKFSQQAVPVTKELKMEKEKHKTCK